MQQCHKNVTSLTSKRMWPLSDLFFVIPQCPHPVIYLIRYSSHFNLLTFPSDISVYILVYSLKTCKLFLFYQENVRLYSFNVKSSHRKSSITLSDRSATKNTMRPTYRHRSVYFTNNTYLAQANPSNDTKDSQFCLIVNCICKIWPKNEGCWHQLVTKSWKTNSFNSKWINILIMQIKVLKYKFALLLLVNAVLFQILGHDRFQLCGACRCRFQDLVSCWNSLPLRR